MSEVSPEGHSSLIKSNAPDKGDEQAQLYRAFSHAGAGPTVDVERFIFSWHARRECRRGLDLLETQDRSSLPGLLSVLEHWTETARYSHWHRSIGTLWKANLDGDREALKASLVRAGIAANLSGISGDWSFELQSPLSLRLGSYLLEEILAGKIRYKDNGAEIMLRTSENTSLQLRLVKGTLEPALSVEAERASISLPQVTATNGYKVSLVPPSLVDSSIIPTYANVDLSNSTLDNSKIALSEALELLECGAQNSFEWVKAVIREVVPLQAPQDQLSSSSSPWLCGLVAITADHRAVPVAEMLVHEASHQHFFIAKHLGPVDDGSDTNDYFSPMVGKNRPIEKMLLALHALGNMVIMYSSLIEHGTADQAHCERQLQKALGKLDSIEPIFEKTSALTPLGIAIYEPLKERITEARRAYAREGTCPQQTRDYES